MKNGVSGNLTGEGRIKQLAAKLLPSSSEDESIPEKPNKKGKAKKRNVESSGLESSGSTSQKGKSKKKKKKKGAAKDDTAQRQDEEEPIRR